MNKIKVALQVYSVRDDVANDFEGTIKKIAEMGYDGVELAGTYGYTPDEIATIVKKYKLECISAHVGYDELVKDTKGTVAAYKKMGCRFIAIPYMGDNERPGSPNFPNVIESIKMIGKECRDNGIQLLYHNHDFEFIKLDDGMFGIDKLYASVPSEYLMPEFDTCWVKVAGQDPVAYIKKYKNETPIVHLKDFVGGKTENMYGLIGTDKKADAEITKFAFRPVGHGVQDMPAIVNASIENGAEWVVVEQDSSEERPPLEAAKMSVDYLKTILK